MRRALHGAQSDTTVPQGSQNPAPIGEPAQLLYPSLPLQSDVRPVGVAAMFNAACVDAARHPDGYGDTDDVSVCDGERVAVPELLAVPDAVAVPVGVIVGVGVDVRVADGGGV